MESPLTFKIIIIGESGTGKSCLLLKFMNEPFGNKHDTTIGIDFRFKNMIVDDKYVKLCIWDTAGQERFQSIIRNYYTGISGIILVFDLNMKSTFDKLSYWINEIKAMRKQTCPIILVGNKSDIKKSVVSHNDIDNFIESSELDIKYFEVSVKNGINVNLVFEELTKKMVSTALIDKNTTTIDLNKSTTTSYLCCSTI